MLSGRDPAIAGLRPVFERFYIELAASAVGRQTVKRKDVRMDAAMTLQEKTARESAGRLDYVDIAKGFMILAVVLSHAWFADSDILGDYLPFSMPVFFFLSGYTYKPGRGYWKNILKRVVALLLPYFLFCTVWNLFLPVYAGLVRQISPFAFVPTKASLWIAVLKADALNMSMCTPMWFLVSLFTASILFFLVADKTRNSLLRTVIAMAVLVAVTLGIEMMKRAKGIDPMVSGALPWFVDLAPYAAALMLFGAWCGGKRVFEKLNAKNIIIGLVLLAVSEALNRVFWGSARTSVAQYIEGGAWYGVLTALVIAVSGCIGTLCVSRLLQPVPILRQVFSWLGRNSLWILCIHYCFIMLVELWIYTKGLLSNSLLDVVSFQLYGFGRVVDTPRDIAIKIAVALVSIGVSAIYALIHNAVKRKVRAARAAKANA